MWLIGLRCQSVDVIHVRDATPADDGQVAVVASEGSSDDAGPAYLAFVRTTGRLLVAVDGDVVLGFAGMVPVGDAAMVTDLFVGTRSRGHGVGGRLLGELLDGWPQRMAFSSQHPAALPAYRRAGLEPRWRLRCLTGRAVGGGPPMALAPWGHDRTDLVEHYRAVGAEVGRDLVARFGPRGVRVLRLVSDEPEAQLLGLLTSLRSGATVWCCVPEQHPLSAWLDGRGFWEIEHDVFCSTPGIVLDGALGCVHPGLL